LRAVAGAVTLACVIRVHRIPFSTNVERVALGCGIKGVEVEWVDHDPDDRAAVLALSGGPLVPVAEFGAEVVGDSMRILERLEALVPDPPLWPPEPAERAAAETFVEWFNEVWKGPPNALDADVPPADAVALSARMQAWTERFERRLAAQPFLLGGRVTIADVCAYPFLRYAARAPDPDDDERFHAILHAELSRGTHPALDRWIGRLAALPRA
jgi:glutathione S-transferase